MADVELQQASNIVQEERHAQALAAVGERGEQRTSDVEAAAASAEIQELSSMLGRIAAAYATAATSVTNAFAAHPPIQRTSFRKRALSAPVSSQCGHELRFAERGASRFPLPNRLRRPADVSVELQNYGDARVTSATAHEGASSDMRV